ncbi:phosphate propanoyltransferase [Telmatospirillum siberiense]|uniref:Phosphate propanoyltransferase n=1 Tax=Telmatospirillum siberiense TaxID=382514 RepID=A0A2N3PUM6_9PROT|nr:phosphate propanoyltransferase [Telmatospirillum siberiense]PKU24090.1 phosphate propanoyltransferase [Telmatospirillum siberiense]
MEVTQEIIERIVRDVLAQGFGRKSCQAGLPPPSVSPSPRDPFQTSVGVSNRHVHLSRADMDSLFGPGSELHRKKAMKQPGQFAAEETVTIRGPKGELRKVRVLGPLRRDTQVEVSVADGYTLGIAPPLRMSGQLDGSPGIEIVGPHGSVQRGYGTIVALRHIHMLPETAAQLGLRNGEAVDVEIGGARGGVMGGVVVRVADASAYEMHVDVEEANAFGLKNDDLVRIRKR